MKRKKWFISMIAVVAGALILISASGILAQDWPQWRGVNRDGLGATAAQEKNEWPCFHGLDRNSKSAETGLLKTWPAEGPELLWTVSDLGEGYSSVTIAEGYLYTAGMIGKQTYVFAFDLNGKQVWKKPNGSSWKTTMKHAMSYTGSRSTLTYDDGMVYHLGELGRYQPLITAAERRSGAWSCVRCSTPKSLNMAILNRFLLMTIICTAIRQERKDLWSA